MSKGILMESEVKFQMIFLNESLKIFLKYFLAISLLQTFFQYKIIEVWSDDFGLIPSSASVSPTGDVCEISAEVFADVSTVKFSDFFFELLAGFLRQFLFSGFFFKVFRVIPGKFQIFSLKLLSKFFPSCIRRFPGIFFRCCNQDVFNFCFRIFT